MAKITYPTPLVEIDGDEMTRVVWQMVKDKLLSPFVELNTEYYDLLITNRDNTDDRVTSDSANAIKKYGVGVKCATITANGDRVKEFNLKKAWPSPNATIRSILDGTVFRKPIIISNIPPAVSSWKKPITLGRHAYGDIYAAKEFIAPSAGKLELVFTPPGGAAQTVASFDYPSSGVGMFLHNLDKSITAFAESCCSYAISEKVELWFGAKDTISKQYHGRFRDIFAGVVERRSEEFKAAGISYRYMLIDDAAAQLMKHPGGIMLALMNYDGDVWSDMIAGGFGSLGLMTSVLVSPDGKFEFEAAHGTVTRHYRQHQKGEKTSTNPIATIYAWTGALKKRGELDKVAALVSFAEKLEAAVIKTVESGTMTKDLALICPTAGGKFVTTEEFIGAIAQKLG